MSGPKPHRTQTSRTALPARKEGRNDRVIPVNFDSQMLRPPRCMQGFTSSLESLLTRLFFLDFMSRLVRSRNLSMREGDLNAGVQISGLKPGVSHRALQFVTPAAGSHPFCVHINRKAPPLHAYRYTDRQEDDEMHNATEKKNRSCWDTKQLHDVR